MTSKTSSRSVCCAALAEGLKVLSRLIGGPLEKNIEFGVFTLVGTFVVPPARVVGFFLTFDLNRRRRSRSVCWPWSAAPGSCSPPPLCRIPGARRNCGVTNPTEGATS